MHQILMGRAPCSGCGDGVYCLLKEIITEESLGDIDIGKVLAGEHTIGKGTIADVTNKCELPCEMKNFAEKHYHRRLLEQLKCVSHHKYFLGEVRRGEVSFEEAMTDWIRKGYVEGFARVYEQEKVDHEIIGFEKLYSLTTERR